MLYKIGKVILFFGQRLLFRIRVYGKENIPKDKNFLLCSNHISMHDPPILGVNLPFKIRYMAKAELFKNPFLAKLFKILGAFPVKRGGNGDSGAIKTAIKLLNNGEIVAIFPEGGRIRDGKPHRGGLGAVMVADHANVGILPVGISGKYGFRQRLNIRIGEFIELSEYLNDNPSQEDYREFTDEVLMKRIGELVYAD